MLRCCQLIKSIQFPATFQGLLMCCCFNWRNSYFWFPMLFLEIIVFQIVLLLRDNYVDTSLSRTTMTHNFQEYTQNIYHLTVVLQRCIRNFLKISCIPLLRLIFSWENYLLWKPITNSNFVVTALWNGIGILLLIWDFDKSQ